MGANATIAGPAAVVEATTRALDSHGIVWCALSGYQSYPAAVPSDLDILVRPDDYGKLRGLMLSLPGLRVIQEKWYEASGHAYVSAPDGPAHDVYVAIDLMASHTYRGLPIMTADDILPDRGRADCGLWIAAPEKEFIYYLTKRIAKSAFLSAADSIDYEQEQKLGDLYRAAPIACARELERYFPAELATLLSAACTDRDWHAVRSRLPDLLKALRRRVWQHRPLKACLERFRNIPRLISRIVRPNGIVVVLLGPDGAGKSTVIDRLQTELAPLFDRTLRFHLRPRSPDNGRRDDNTVTNPYEKPRRGPVRSLLQLGHWWVEHTLGYWAIVYPRLVTQSCVLFDRSHIDLQCDPARYRYGGPRSLARLLSRLLPGADLHIILDIDPATAVVRQPEMSVAESSRQRDAYQRFAARRDDCVIVDASEPPAAVAAAVRDAISDFMARRIQRRGLSWA